MRPLPPPALEGDLPQLDGAVFRQLVDLLTSPPQPLQDQRAVVVAEDILRRFVLVDRSVGADWYRSRLVATIMLGGEHHHSGQVKPRRAEQLADRILERWGLGLLVAS